MSAGQRSWARRPSSIPPDSFRRFPGTPESGARWSVCREAACRWASTPRPVCCWSSSIRFAAWALVSVSSIGSPASSLRVFRYECWAAVMGSPPVVHSSGSFRVCPVAGLCRVSVCRSATIFSSCAPGVWGCVRPPHMFQRLTNLSGLAIDHLAPVGVEDLSRHVRSIL